MDTIIYQPKKFNISMQQDSTVMIHKKLAHCSQMTLKKKK